MCSFALAGVWDWHMPSLPFQKLPPLLHQRSDRRCLTAGRRQAVVTNIECHKAYTAPQGALLKRKATGIHNPNGSIAGIALSSKSAPHKALFPFQELPHPPHQRFPIVDAHQRCRRRLCPRCLCGVWCIMPPGTVWPARNSAAIAVRWASARPTASPPTHY